MKQIKIWLAGMVCICTLLFTSCSEEKPFVQDQEKAVLSLSALLNDLVGNRAATKQANDTIPECSDSTAVYVEIILSQNGLDVVGAQGNPFRVDLVEGQVFTEEVPELELTPGDYSLDFFAVFDGSGNALWVAPMAGSELANFVEEPLPLAISLGAGVKKYVEVPVLCFDDRIVNEYGYLFFELIPTQAIEWCIFGNYCDETGRHYPAEFSVSIWNYENGEIGSQLYNNLTNSVELNEDGDFAGTTVCVALPDVEGLDEYYVEISLLNSDAYGDVTESVIREGVINDTQIKNLFSGEDALDYFHFREGCDGADSPGLFDEMEPVNTFYGPSMEIGGGTAQTLVKINDSGELKAVGVRISEDVLGGLPSNFEHITLQFPEEAEGMVFEHFDMEWNPNGHEPLGVYDIPHFDMHFYMISEAEKMMITDAALAEILPDAQYWPETYVPTPGFVPIMGKHWISTESGEANGEVFDQTFIYGSYNGNFIFYEPMITIDYLMDKTDEEYSIFQPDVFQRTGYYYPTTYSISYDEVNNEYVILLEDMVLR